MNVYELEYENVIRCSDCGKDIEKLNKFHMFAFAPNKNNCLQVYLCEECKNELKWLLSKI